jgi:hypothetical protein
VSDFLVDIKIEIECIAYISDGHKPSKINVD